MLLGRESPRLRQQSLQEEGHVALVLDAVGELLAGQLELFATKVDSGPHHLHEDLQLPPLQTEVVETHLRTVSP